MEKVENKFNILVIHAHWNNRGDEAAIRAMIDSLRSSLPIGKMRIMIFARNVVDFNYDDIEVLRPFPNTPTDLADCVLTLLSLGKISLTESGRRFINAVDEADAVIHAPGGPSIGDIYRGGYGPYTYLYRLFFSRIIKKKQIFFYAPSMGPFTCKIENPLRKFLLKRAGAIVLREAISGEYLERQLGLKSIVTCDSALQNTVTEDYIDRYNNLSTILKLIEEKRVIGLTITDLKWHPVHGESPHLEGRIRESLSGAMEALLDKGYYVLLIPQAFGDGSDVPLLRQFRDLNKDRIFILPENVDSYGQQVLISRLHSIIGMRYHSNIFAAKGGIPFLSICYEHKMKGFMDKLGLSEFTINVEEITAQGIVEMFEYLESNHEQVKSMLNERIPELQRLSRRTTEIIANEIRRGS